MIRNRRWLCSVQTVLEGRLALQDGVLPLVTIVHKTRLVPASYAW